MIGIMTVLVLLQVWPSVFGQRSASDISVPLAHAAAGNAVDQVRGTASAWETSNPPACFAEYRRTLNACAKGDKACETKTVNAFDLCEATGFWPQ
ncbi:hypothetical protein H5J25_09825 [Sphingomonas aliaeris]|uniref:Uncharacterized protein n=1 Tax=Sphingomonas aliaeris TaxID=2759526 RepID=A0A974NS74_9SPHN|nr:hypothetical protein [Sphingomonas aliaeris]QQV75907.1 hypothetical protein H5J25_09825 [Sphingomonas aliaeris]